MTLLEKLVAIRDTAGFHKDRKIETKKRSYEIWTEGSVLKTLRPLFKEYKLLPVREAINVHYTDAKTSKLTVTMRMFDLESDQTIVFTGVGTGFDSIDKDSGMASTYATKDAYLKLFMAVSGNDPDQVGSDSGEQQLRGEAMGKLTAVYDTFFFHVKAAREIGMEQNAGWEKDPAITNRAQQFFNLKKTEIETKAITEIANLIQTMDQILSRTK